MLKSVESNKKSLEELQELYEQALLTYNTENDIEDEKDTELIERIKEVYNIEDNDFKITCLPQFIFAKRFRNILNIRKLKGIEAQELVGIRKETISKYKNGYEYPSIDTILKIAKRLQISPYYLLGLSKYTTLESTTINELLGLSEDSMKILFMLQHNIGECEELTDDVPISNQNKLKLHIFNSFIEDNVNFLKFLCCIEQYTKLKETVRKDKNVDKENIKSQLLRTKRRYDKYIA